VGSRPETAREGSDDPEQGEQEVVGIDSVYKALHIRSAVNSITNTVTAP
jgi:hypothetical protein